MSVIFFSNYLLQSLSSWNLINIDRFLFAEESIFCRIFCSEGIIKLLIYLLADQVNYLSLSELLAARYCVTSNRVVEINIMMVEIAAIVGSMKSRKALNICLVMVAFFPPEIKMEMIMFLIKISKKMRVKLKQLVVCV